MNKLAKQHLFAGLAGLALAILIPVLIIGCATSTGLGPYTVKEIILPDGYHKVNARCWNNYSRDSNGYSWDCFYAGQWYGIKSDTNTSDHIIYGPLTGVVPFVVKEMWIIDPQHSYENYHNLQVNASCLKNKNGFHSPWSCYYKGEWYWVEDDGRGHLQN